MWTPTMRRGLLHLWDQTPSPTHNALLRARRRHGVPRVGGQHLCADADLESPEVGVYCCFLLELKDELEYAPLNIEQLQEVLSLKWFAAVYPPGRTKDRHRHPLRRQLRHREVQALCFGTLYLCMTCVATIALCRAGVRCGHMCF